MDLSNEKSHTIMNIRKAKKKYPGNIYLKEMISLIKAGNRSKARNCPKSLKAATNKITKHFIKFFNKWIKTN